VLYTAGSSSRPRGCLARGVKVEASIRFASDEAITSGSGGRKMGSRRFLVGVSCVQIEGRYKLYSCLQWGFSSGSEVYFILLFALIPLTSSTPWLISNNTEPLWLNGREITSLRDLASRIVEHFKC
jgi:hypothetical protein